MYDLGSQKIEKKMDVLYLVRKLWSLEYRLKELTNQTQPPKFGKNKRKVNVYQWVEDDFYIDIDGKKGKDMDDMSQEIAMIERKVHRGAYESDPDDNDKNKVVTPRDVSIELAEQRKTPA